MVFIIENLYNTSYISTILLALFYKPSIIERSLIIDNNNSTLYGILLQKCIQKNFISLLRKNTNITIKNINNIRNNAFLHGWHNNNLNELIQKYDPIDFIIFIMKIISFIPFTITYNDITEDTYIFNLNLLLNNDDIQNIYFQESINKKIINIPQFIIFNVELNNNNIKINKKIKLFPKNHEYNQLLWTFHSCIYKLNNQYHVLINENNELCDIVPNEIINVNKINSIITENIDNIYIIYTKNPMI